MGLKMAAGKLPVSKLLGLAFIASTSSVINGIVSAQGSASAGLALGISSLIGGVFGNYIASLSQHKLEDGPTPPESLILNRDLRHLTGEAIAAVLELATKPDEHGKPRVPESQHAVVRRLRDGAIDAWMSESAATDKRFEGMSEQQLAAEFATSEVEFSHHRALDPAAWLAFLETLAQPLDEKPAPETLDALAKLLHERLPQMIRGKVKQDFEGDTETGGRGFASLHLMLMGKLLEGVKTLVDRPDAQKSLETELLEQLKRFNENAGPRIAQHDKRLTRHDRDTLSGMIHQFNTLRPHIDKRINDVLRAIAKLEAVVRLHHKETSHRLKWIGAAIVAAVLLGGIGWALVMSGQQETHRLATDLANRLDESEKLVKQFLAQRPLASKGPLVIPQLIGDLKLRAEELIAKGNKRQSLVAAVAMNDFPTADRLQTEIRAQLKSDRVIDDYELATLEGDRWYRANKPDKAIEPYELALKIRPNDIVALRKAAFAHAFAKLGDNGTHQKRSIEIFETMLTLVKPRTAEWAFTQNDIGSTWLSLFDGDDVAIHAKATAAFEAALTILAKDSHSDEWATIQHNLGNAWLRLPKGENATKAVAAYEAALTVRTKNTHQIDWAKSQINLGTAMRYLTQGSEDMIFSNGANFDKSIDKYEAALSVLTKDSNPDEWAIAQSNLGDAWLYHPKSDRAAYVSKAIAAYEAVITVYTKDTHPIDWADTQSSLAAAWETLRTGEKDANIRNAISAYQAALHVYTKENQLSRWGWTQYKLAKAWASLTTGNRSANLDKAIASYEAVLTVYTKDTHPKEWFSTQLGLGNAWQDLDTGYRPANLAKAIAAYEAALSVGIGDTRYERELYSSYIQLRIGRAWQDLDTGDRSSNLSKAIAAYESVLPLLTKAAPERRAEVQHMLCVARTELAAVPGSDRCAALIRAIAFGKAALLIYTPTAYPDEHRSTRKNLELARRAYESAGCDKAVPFDAIAPAE